jgi:putative SOS response-associated peptidase YedK
MLLPEDEERWLDPDLTEPEEILRFLVPYPDELLEARAA